MVKKLSIVALLLLTTGCTLLPDKFDNVEYDHLVTVDVWARYSESCNRKEIDEMVFHSRVLKAYSAGTLNDNVAGVYAEINDLVEELSTRESPSYAYCKLKRENISNATTKAIEVFGGRLKQ